MSRSKRSEWFRTSDDVRRGFARGAFGVKVVSYSAINGMAIFEGDIALGSVERMELLLAQGMTERIASAEERAIAISGRRYRWPNREVPYEIDPELPPGFADLVKNAIFHWERWTPIRFFERTPATALRYPHYVRFVSKDGCWSYVGMQGKEQEVSLGNGCDRGAAIHEIGHVVGLWHEQSREDRDTYISIAWDNIAPDQKHNFEQHITDGDDIGPYDYDSIMHYGPYAFSINDQPTIIVLAPDRTIGQRRKLSQGDIAAVQALYG